MKVWQSCFIAGSETLYDDVEVIIRRLNLAIRHLVEVGVRYFFTLGNPGFDMTAAHAVVFWRSVFPDLRLFLVSQDKPVTWTMQRLQEIRYLRNVSDDCVCLNNELYTNIITNCNYYLNYHRPAPPVYELICTLLCPNCTALDLS